MTEAKALEGAARGKARYTPGPWYWRSGSDDYAALLSEIVGGPIIQTTHGVDPETPDAKLIAAAPALTAALAYFVWMFGETPNGEWPQQIMEDPSTMTSTLERAGAALRAAGVLASAASARNAPPEAPGAPSGGEKEEE